MLVALHPESIIHLWCHIAHGSVIAPAMGNPLICKIPDCVLWIELARTGVETKIRAPLIIYIGVSRV